MCQLIIYDMLCLAVTRKDGEKNVCTNSSQKIRENPVTGVTGTERSCNTAPWLIFAVSVYILSLVYKPTALIFSTALGGVGLVCLLIFKKQENRIKEDF